ncbi:hypothetical protein PJIAN_1493 [Paludibacter jiangxiensis]|uniref:Uncharacterized protein n=1 Tax=Paludibacter jiangxiensis TaxID=681398 RepID=A0A161LI02_9BACT|nr:hypothetical protein PJIAN_1493 [Paludibacter jiangxiensis]
MTLFSHFMRTLFQSAVNKLHKRKESDSFLRYRSLFVPFLSLLEERIKATFSFQLSIPEILKVLPDYP